MRQNCPLYWQAKTLPETSRLGNPYLQQISAALVLHLLPKLLSLKGKQWLCADLNESREGKYWLFDLQAGHGTAKSLFIWRWNRLSSIVNSIWFYAVDCICHACIIRTVGSTQQALGHKYCRLVGGISISRSRVSWEPLKKDHRPKFLNLMAL